MSEQIHLELAYKSEYDPHPLYHYIKVGTVDQIDKIMDAICDHHIRLDNEIDVKIDSLIIKIPLWKWSDKSGLRCVYKFSWLNVLKNKTDEDIELKRKIDALREKRSDLVSDIYEMEEDLKEARKELEDVVRQMEELN